MQTWDKYLKKKWLTDLTMIVSFKKQTYLFQHKNVFVEEVLKVLICIIYAHLFKAVTLEDLQQNTLHK